MSLPQQEILWKICSLFLQVSPNYNTGENICNYVMVPLATKSLMRLMQGSWIVKHFTDIIYSVIKKARVFAIFSYFQTSLMFWGKTKAYPSGVR